MVPPSLREAPMGRPPLSASFGSLLLPITQLPPLYWQKAELWPELQVSLGSQEEKPDELGQCQGARGSDVVRWKAYGKVSNLTKQEAPRGNTWGLSYIPHSSSLKFPLRTLLHLIWIRNVAPIFLTVLNASMLIGLRYSINHKKSKMQALLWR